jgi:hypothetical protein
MRKQKCKGRPYLWRMIVRYHVMDVSPEEEEIVECHLSLCEHCRDAYEEFKTKLIGDRGNEPILSDDLEFRI